MKTSILIATAALAVSGAAVAEPVTRTTTYDGPKVDATRVAVRDKAAGTYNLDATATRASDGATASRAYDRACTDTGVAVASRSDVQFNRNVSLTRAAGFRRRGFGSGRRQ